MEVQTQEESEIKLTSMQKAKAKYYIKNREAIIDKIVEYNKTRYHNDNDYRQYVLDIHKAYYEKNKAKKREYYLKRKQLKLEQHQSIKV